jgi:hypothetical protein
MNKVGGSFFSLWRQILGSLAYLAIVSAGLEGD